VLDTDQDMCEEFNKFFGSVFTKEKLGDIPEANLEYKENDNGVCNIYITEEILIDRLRNDKAAGADESSINQSLFANAITQVNETVAISYRR